MMLTLQILSSLPALKLASCEQPKKRVNSELKYQKT